MPLDGMDRRSARVGWEVPDAYELVLCGSCGEAGEELLVHRGGGGQLRAPATATAARAVRADAPREVWGNGVAGGRGGGGGGGAAAPAGGLPGAAARAATVAAASRGPSLPRQGPSTG